MQEKKAGAQVIMILYFALLMSQLMMIGVGYYFTLPGGHSSAFPLMLYLFLSLSLVLLFLSHKFYLKAVKKYSDQEIENYTLPQNQIVIGDPAQKLALIRQGNYILSWALGEAVTIMGTIMPFFGYGLPVMITFWTLGLANHLAKRPLK
jgi:hypothetical protein